MIRTFYGGNLLELLTLENYILIHCENKNMLLNKFKIVSHALKIKNLINNQVLLQITQKVFVLCVLKLNIKEI